ncbi:uncharacterized protein LOC119691963 [Plutella xylostella]|uniref:uncharacterized protein LOC119691963 n=1 Tax=Plutella xylostella TaxID=51655 RepID=UPI0018D146F4|nr:uncharacterized protein LOC119691963 [Plutella xylostella]
MGSDSDTSSSASTTTNESKKRKSRSKREKHRKRRRESSSSRLIQALSMQVNNLEQLVSQNIGLPSAIANSAPPQPSPEVQIDANDEITSNVSGELYESLEQEPAQQFSFPLNTELKEPVLIKSDPVLVERLKSIQHFDSTNWCDVRYSEVQKRYCSTPGFTDLECNDELKPFDRLHNLALLERGFAAMTKALIKQHEAVENGFKSLISWLQSAEVVELSVFEAKIHEIFSEGEFHKISADLLQMACGHRADLIQQRRDAILKAVKDKFFKETLRKIPPSCEHLFKSENLTSSLEKQGGVSKACWPVRPITSKSGSYSQNIGNQTKNSKVPAQGTRSSMATYMPYMPPAHGVPWPQYSPAQGVPFSNQQYIYPLQPQGPRLPAQGRSFRQQGPRFSQGAGPSSTRKPNQASAYRDRAKRKF